MPRSFSAFVVGGILLAATACAPAPRNVACSNDGQCRDIGGDFNYCLESRCVECVGRASCGSASSCVDGRCITECKDERDCPSGKACMDGTCARP